MPFPTPEEILDFFAVAVRGARKRRDWTQARLAKEAGVSLAQVALLEKGRNVSVAFLAKVAGALELKLTLSPDEGAGAAGGLDIVEVIRRAELLSFLAHDLRTFVRNSATQTLRETAVVDRFVERALGNPDGFARLADALHQLSREGRVPTRPKAPQVEAGRRRTRKTQG